MRARIPGEGKGFTTPTPLARLHTAQGVRENLLDRCPCLWHASPGVEARRLVLSDGRPPRSAQRLHPSVRARNHSKLLQIFEGRMPQFLWPDSRVVVARTQPSNLLLTPLALLAGLEAGAGEDATHSTSEVTADRIPATTEMGGEGPGSMGLDSQFFVASSESLLSEGFSALSLAAPPFLASKCVRHLPPSRLPRWHRRAAGSKARLPRCGEAHRSCEARECLRTLSP